MKFTVTLERTESAELVVEAENEGAAREQAINRIECSDCVAEMFGPEDDGEWDLVDDQIRVGAIVPIPLGEAGV